MGIKVIPVLLFTLAFLLCATCLGIIMGDTSSSLLPSWVERYQTLLTGFLAIVAACIGVWGLFQSQEILKRQENEAFLLEMARIAFIINRESLEIKSSVRGYISMDSYVIKRVQSFRDLLNIHRIYSLNSEAGDIAQELYFALLDPSHRYGPNTADLSNVIKRSCDLHRILS